MGSELHSAGHSSDCRFEFRSFGQDFDNAAKRMSRLSMPVPEELWERNSNETYIVSPDQDSVNVKVRGKKVEIKQLVQLADGLEQWAPMLKCSFPLDVSVLQNEFFPLLQLEVPKLIKEAYQFDELIALIRTHTPLYVVNVHKQRFGYQVNNTICETGIVLVNGARITTISCESAEIADVKKTIRDVGLEGIENINYVQAIKRILGVITKPFAN